MDNLRRYRLLITGATPLLMHQDNLDWSDFLTKWLSDPINKKSSVPGDDRSPGWKWLGALYHDGRRAVVPSTMLMASLRAAGSTMTIPGKGKKTYKAQTQSGMRIEEPEVPVLIEGREVPVSSLLKLRSEMDFEVHREAVEKLGFSLDTRRASVGRSKHVRVRPRFDTWSLDTSILVWDDQLTQEVLHRLWTVAGAHKGIGDWRPSSGKSGAYGTFSVELEEI